MTEYEVNNHEFTQPSGRATASIATVVLAALLFLATAIVGWVVIQRMHDSLRWVLHTYEARGEIRQVRIRIIDLSGRIATASALGDPHFLQGLPGDFLGQSVSISSLRALTRDNPSQQARLTQLNSLLAGLQSKFGTCESSLECLPGSAAARQNLLRSAWNEREIMLTILDAMENDEDGLLRQRLAGWSSHYRLMVLVLVLCFAAAVILIFFNLRLLRAEAERRWGAARMR